MKIKKKINGSISAFSFEDELSLKCFVLENLNTTFRFKYYNKIEACRIIGYSFSASGCYFIVEPLDEAYGWRAHNFDSSAKIFTEFDRGWYVPEIYSI